MDTLVSVIVPVYNVEKYLDRCVESLVTQSYPNLEIILVDDGSKDRSSAMCDSWSCRDHRVTVIHKENAGAGMARNTGLNHASGRYVLFVDSDDYIHPAVVEKCLYEAENTKADIVMFGRNDVFADGRVIPKPVRKDKLHFFGREVQTDILPGLFTYKRGMGTSVWGKLYNLELIQRNGIKFRSEREVLSEDACFNLSIFSLVSSVSILPEQMYYYYKNDNSLSHSYKPGHQMRNDAFCREALRLCQQFGYTAEVASRVKVRYHMYAISGMKRIVKSPLPRKEKDAQMRRIFDNEFLRGTLTSDTLELEQFQSRIFWKLFQGRFYHACYALIYYKANR